jgi:hypothetical protein
MGRLVGEAQRLKAQLAEVRAGAAVPVSLEQVMACSTQATHALEVAEHMGGNMRRMDAACLMLTFFFFRKSLTVLQISRVRGCAGSSTGRKGAALLWPPAPARPVRARHMRGMRSCNLRRQLCAGPGLVGPPRGGGRAACRAAAQVLRAALLPAAGQHDRVPVLPRPLHTSEDGFGGCGSRKGTAGACCCRAWGCCGAFVAQGRAGLAVATFLGYLLNNGPRMCHITPPAACT